MYVLQIHAQMQMHYIATDITSSKNRHAPVI